MTFVCPPGGVLLQMLRSCLVQRHDARLLEFRFPHDEMRRLILQMHIGYLEAKGFAGA